MEKYIKLYKLKKAKQILQENNLNVSEIETEITKKDNKLKNKNGNNKNK